MALMTRDRLGLKRKIATASFDRGGMGIARTWVVTAEQAREIASLADSLRVTHSAMVRWLLGQALMRVRSGVMPVRKRPVRWELVNDDDDASLGQV